MEKKTEHAKKEIQTSIIQRVIDFQKLGQIKLPPDYSPENAVRAAFLILKDKETKDELPVLEVCTKASIANAMLSMVIQGLNPLKGQCAFIAYGNKLTMQREYGGTIALAKRVGGVKAVYPEVIYEKDEFEYEIDVNSGRKKIIKHKQSFENIDKNKIKGAYCTIVLEDGTTDVEVMTMTQIREAWLMGKAKGQSQAHKNFPDQMAKKTVASRACKLYINTSSDGYLYDGEDASDPSRLIASKEGADEEMEPLTLYEAVDDEEERPVPEVKVKERTKDEAEAAEPEPEPEPKPKAKEEPPKAKSEDHTPVPSWVNPASGKRTKEESVGDLFSK